MTSGKFKSFSISSIVVERGARQRRELRDIEELAESINRIGLINPIVITPEGLLVAGERRFEACKSLGWTAIPVQFTTDLPPRELRRIELEENVKRKALTWQEESMAIRELHEFHKEENAEWTRSDTAEAIGYTRQTVDRHLSVANEIAAGNERVAAADKFSVARNMVERTQQRKTESVLADVSASVAAIAAPEDLPDPEPIKVPLLNADFHKWQESYDGQKFNLIHCDFPYGINVADGPRQNSAIKDHYEDTEEVYFHLLSSLGNAMENVVADSAHLIFWFAMSYYSDTLSILERMGWRVNPYPLVWHKSDNAGVAPDPQRWPRRTYETAFMATRGDRKLTEVGAKSNSFAYAGKRSDGAHVSEKPVPMLTHFMSMVCDEYSTILDPTCGSGNSIKSAYALGAAGGLGLEINEEFYQRAVDYWMV